MSTDPSTGTPSIAHRGVLIRECSLPGERRSDDVVPAHPNGIPVSRDRWLLVYATRSFRGNDDDCSIVYQLRADAPDGRLIREGMLARSVTDWNLDPSGEGPRLKKEHRAPVAFGVPRGALIRGKPAVNANFFCVAWSRVGRLYDAARNYVEGTNVDPGLERRTQAVEWVQARLNDAGDDLERLGPVEELRERGYENGEQVCSLPGASWVAQGKTQPVPCDRECLQWVVCDQFSGMRYAAVKLSFDLARRRYDWVQTGPALFDPSRFTQEGAIARWRGSWVAAARTDYVENHVRIGRGLAWVRTEDPFAQPGPTVYPPEPAAAAPVSVYQCPDGVLRYFAGDGTHSPYRNDHDPLYCWDIDPDRGFVCANRRVVFDSVQAGLPIRREAEPKVDMCKLLPHVGDTQYLVHRVSVVSMLHEHVHTKPVRWVFPPVNDEEKRSCAIYYATIRYDRAYPMPWEW